MRDGRVFFRYRDHRGADGLPGRGPHKVMWLAVDDFIARVLEHVPPPGMQTVRGYGLYSNSKRPDLAVAREHFGQVPTPPESKVTWRDLCERAGRGQSLRCPVCDAPLVVHGRFSPRSPFLSAAGARRAPFQAFFWPCAGHGRTPYLGEPPGIGGNLVSPTQLTVLRARAAPLNLPAIGA
jgi:hypothetical protein